MKHGFTLLEVMIVVIIIGILSALGYSSLNELIQTSKAKEAARLITTFVERSLAEGKMRKESVTITIIGSAIQAKTESGLNINEPISNGFSASSNTKLESCDATANITSMPDITTIFKKDNETTRGPVCFVVCNAGGYCGGALKDAAKNYFTAKIKNKKSTSWEAL